jgi:catechol 2,3-dioxygenase-like lactoylglutathione lyase family enzyme
VSVRPDPRAIRQIRAGAQAPRIGQTVRVPGEIERPWPADIDHVGLSVTDLDTSTDFYCNVLGAQVVFGAHDADSFRRVVVRLGSSLMDINQFTGNDGTRFDVTRTGLDHLAFTAASPEALEDWASWLDANRVARSAIRDIPGPIVGAMFDFVDPDGIQLEFIFVQLETLPGVVR